jgi:hypothetical protein
MRKVMPVIFRTKLLRRNLVRTFFTFQEFLQSPETAMQYDAADSLRICRTPGTSSVRENLITMNG